MIKRLIKLRYIIIFALIIYLGIILSTYTHSKYHTELYLENKTELSKIAYETIYGKIKQQSEIIFQEKINTKKIIDIFKNAKDANNKQKIQIRETLYNELSPSYHRLRKLVNLRQVHFHLPNNHSFLRMHKKNKFGDDLSHIRETVEYVNRYKKKIDGFEEGRVYNGFRFVYPLFDDSKVYIGSVEVSFSAQSVQRALSRDLRFSQFLFSKKIIDSKVWKEQNAIHYTPAAISPNFSMESSWMDDQFARNKRKIMKNITPEMKEIFHQNIEKEIAYSMVINIDDNDFVLSFLPIHNPVSKNLVAYLVIITHSSYFKNLSFDNIIFQLIALALLLSNIIIIYRQNKHDEIIQKQNYILLEQSKMAQMGSMLSNIAHQWKQPLARINAKVIEIPLSLTLKKEEEILLNDNLEDIEKLTSYMANTIENFRTFFHPNKERNYFSINDAVDKTLLLLDLKDEKITLSFYQYQDIRINGYEDELIQVLMILIINAKEALGEMKVQNHNPFIKIILTKENFNIQIKIIDNARGINPKIAEQIFNPYFSTKSTNSGIGLYMSRMIIELSMKGKLNYKRENNESCFCITLKDKNA